MQRYRAKVSGPLLDRIDIQIEVPAIRFQEMASENPAEQSTDIRIRVNQARKIQQERFQGKKIHSNAQMTSKNLKKYCQIDDTSKRLLETAIDKLGLSARAYTRILKVARTIADLEGSEPILTPHISEAIQYRSLDRRLM